MFYTASPSLSWPALKKPNRIHDPPLFTFSSSLEKNRERHCSPTDPTPEIMTVDGRGKSQTMSELGLTHSKAWWVRKSTLTEYNLWEEGLWGGRHCGVQGSGLGLSLAFSEESISLKAQLPQVSWAIIPWEFYFFVGKISNTQHGFFSSLIVIRPPNWKADLVVCRAFMCDGKMLTIINYFIVQQGCKIINWLFGR